MRSPRLTQRKADNLRYRIESASVSVTKILTEVESLASNPKAKHYQDLCDLRSDLRCVVRRLEVAYQSSRKVNP